MDIKARDIMTREVLTVTPEMTVKDFANFLLQHKISGAPVVGPDGSVVGIATEGDLIFRDARMHLPTLVTIFDTIIYLESPKKFEHELHKALGGTVADIMTAEVLTVTPETSIQELATIMREKKRHLLPVIESKRLVGIVGKADLVQAIAREE